jgi:membrane-associated phospholipid phosphatase
MPRTLIADAWRKPAASAAAVAVLLVAGLAVAVHRSTTSFDSWTFRELYAHIGAGAAATLLGLSAPVLSLGLLALVVLFATLLRRWDVVALAVIAPVAAIVITKGVLKPLVGRPIVVDGVTMRGAFPSGHETAVSATALVLLIVACRLPLRARGRGIAVGVLAAWTVLAAVGLVRNFWHYATDTIGAFGVSLAVVPAVALLIDRFVPRVSGPGARNPASTTRAA